MRILQIPGDESPGYGGESPGYGDQSPGYGLIPFPSQANFILCRVVGREAAQLKQALARRGILVRYFNKPGLQDCIRISVGKPEHTDALIQALRELE